MARFWNFILNTNKEDNTEEVELRIEGDIIDDDYAWLYEWFGIAATSPNAFKEELNQYKGKNITVWIDSYGGSVFAAAGIYNALMEHKKTGAKVTTKADSKVMSAATIPFAAGDDRLMSPMAIHMMHNPLTEVYGYASDLRKTADVLDEVKETIINAYQLSTGRSRAKISQMMDDETYMSAKTAIKEGFATGMLYADSNDPDTEVDDIMNLKYGRIMAIQNAANDSFRKFFEINKANLSNENSAPQAGVPKPQPDANITNNSEGDDLMPPKTIEELRNTCPELVRQIEDAAREEGAKTERQRIQDIEKISANINPDLVNKAKFEEPVDAKELAFNALKEDGQKGQQYLTNVQTDAQNSGANEVPASSGEGSGAKPKNTQDKLKNIAADFDARRRGVNR